ncbi:family 16 glycosylhydrolase [Pseudobacteriovorax antillogorgiicola]|uniref:Glycosyl hydrolases family 16 n=1 Tax=Pseudobacteriovorax antillogorgiicola TaxID=1513793 RepID=A0A1Y6C8N6_9BACT|nr:family 16 glycosylhydrolase [Pseudobacteriovorax antillogorgiicola]TCS49106.1 glycosyl hydrolase family 16 [Pseudobacteriovorax antillogorgiicola]SMF51667.1 Glycosyl hydrolases family 16 [Pseudobacteriovorax antillogorgiicola]
MANRLWRLGNAGVLALGIIGAGGCGFESSSGLQQLQGLPAAYPGYTGQYQGFTLKVDDRFDYFNGGLWTRGDGAFGETKCRFQQQGAQVRDGELQLLVRPEFVPASYSNDQNRIIGAYNYSCGEVRSRSEYLYGRFEVRMRNPVPQRASGYISSLFTYRNREEENYRWREIDIEMEGIRPNKFQSNLILGEGTYDWSATRLWGAYEQVQWIGATSQWKVYAMEWTPASIKWFVDGRLMRTLSRSDVNQKQASLPPHQRISIPELPGQVMMNFWIPNDLIAPVFGGVTTGNQYPIVVRYDWFRYYAYTP